MFHGDLFSHLKSNPFINENTVKRTIESSPRIASDLLSSLANSEPSRYGSRSLFDQQAIDEIVRLSVKESNPATSVSNDLPRTLRVDSPFATRRLDYDATAGFVSRASKLDYAAIFNSPGTLNAVFFQLQNNEIASQLIMRNEPVNLLTQRVEPMADEQRASILAPNELLLSSYALLKSGHQVSTDFVANLRNEDKWKENIQGSWVGGVYSAGSFHLKTGYTDKYAFIGTQNITAALSRNNSIESLLVFEKGKSKLGDNIREEIEAVTDTAMTLAKSNSHLSPGALGRELDSRKDLQLKYLYTNDKIFDVIYQAIDKATYNPGSKVIISMGEISLLTNRNENEYVKDLKGDLLTLASQGRLQIVTDSKKLQATITDIATQKPGVHSQFISRLLDYQAIKGAPTVFHHDKTIAVFNQENKLEFFSIGSANLSANSLLPISEIPSGEYKDKLLMSLGTLADSPEAQSSTVNTELVLALNRDEETQEYLDYLVSRPSFIHHYEALTGKSLSTGKNLYNSGYISERYTYRAIEGDKTKALGELKALLDKQKYVKSSIRWTEGNSATPGLRVEIASPLGGHSLKLDFGISSEGNVILLDLNKVLNQALYVNQASSEVDVFGVKVRPGESTLLNSVETASAFVATARRMMIYQDERSLVDTVFARYANTRKEAAMFGAREILREILGEVINSTTTSGDAPNLLSLATQLHGENQYLPLLTVLKDKLATEAQGDRLSPIDAQRRYTSLTDTFAALGTVTKNPGIEGAAYSIYSGSDALIDLLLHDDTGLWSDLKRRLIMQDSESREYYRQAARAQSRAILSVLASPFLAPHELTYSYGQASSRTPIYGRMESQTREWGIGSGENPSEWGLLMQEGFLDPLPVTHATRIGKPGQFYRMVGSTAYEKNARLPGFGGLRSVTVAEADISKQAAVVHETAKLFSSTPGLTRYSQEDIEKLLTSVGASLSEEEQTRLENMFRGGAFLHVPFEKEEQITQRLKNLVGTRAALDVAPEFVSKGLRKLRVADEVYQRYGVSKDDQGESILAGRLKTVLPTTQIDQVRRAVKVLQEEGILNPTYEDVQEYFRRRALDPMNTERGALGTPLKRIAIHHGFSFLGDYVYRNAEAVSPIGQVSRIRTKLNFSSINTTEAIAAASEAFAGGVIATSETLKLSDGTTLTPGLYKYTDDGKLEQVGYYTKSGEIALKNLNRTREVKGVGIRREPVAVRLPSYVKRNQRGLTQIVSDAPSITVTARNTLNIEFDAVTSYMESSGSRWLGSGLAKGPVLFLDDPMGGQGVFSDVETALSSGHSDLIPQEAASSKIYALSSFNNFKGYSYETGLSILSDDASYGKLTEKLKGVELARSLALIFLGDKGTESRQSVKEALIRNFSQAGEHTSALAFRDAKGVDFSKLKNNSAFAALGLTLLTGDSEDVVKGLLNNDLEGLKSLVVSSLLGDQKAINTLTTNALKLFELARNAEDTTKLKGQDGTTYRFIDETKITNRGAGLLAHLYFFNRQFFGATSESRTVSGIYEVPLDNVNLYKGRKSSVGGLNHQQYKALIDMVAAEQGIKLEKDDEEKLSQQLTFLQTRLNTAIPFENLLSVTTSQSLVPTGQSDKTKMEFQYLLGWQADRLEAYRDAGGGGEDSLTIQNAYLMALAATHGNLIASTSGPGLQYSTFLRTEKQVGTLTDAMIKQRATLLSYVTGGDAERYRRAILKDELDPKILLEITNAFNKGTATTAEDDYIDAVTRAEAIYLEAMQRNPNMKERLTPMLEDLRRTRQLIMPAFEAVALEDGRYRLSFRSPQEAEPTRGVILGADILKNAALTFGSHKDEILTTQIALISGIVANENLLQRITASGSSTTVSGAELDILNYLQSTMEMSKNSMLKLGETEFMRKAYGDHESFHGAVGISVNSFALNAEEYMVGARFERVTEGWRVGQSIKGFVRMLSSDDMEVRSTGSELLTRMVKQLNPKASLDIDSQGGMLVNRESYALLLTAKLNVLQEKRAGSRINPDKIDLNNIEKRQAYIDNLRETKGEYLSSSSIKPHEYADYVTALIYSQVLGLNYQEAARLYYEDKIDRTQHLSSQVALRSGASIRRTGAPSTSQMLATEEGDTYTYIPLQTFQNRLAQGGSKLHIAKQQFETASIIPSLSGVMSGLGDYDGDSFSFTLSALGQRAQELAAAQGEIDRVGKLKSRFEVLDPSYLQQVDTLDTSLSGMKNRVSKVREVAQLTDNLLKVIEEQSNRATLKTINEFSLGYLQKYSPLVSNVLTPEEQEAYLTNAEQINETEIGVFDAIKGELSGLYTKELSKELSRYKRLQMTKMESTVSEMERLSAVLDQQEGAMLDATRRMVENYLGLPSFLTEDMSHGEVFSLLRQKFDISGISDAGETNRRALEHVSRISTLLKNQGGFKDELMSAVDKEDTQGLLKYFDDDEVYTKSLVSFLRERGVIDNPNEIERLVMVHESIVGNLTMTTEGISKTLKKTAGSILNPFEFDAVTQVIGLGGTSLIGEAYNTLLPLVNPIMMESAIARLPEDQRQKLFGADFNIDEGFIKERYAKTVSIFTGFQQIVRDALKAKESGGIIGLLNEKINGELTLGEYLTTIDDDEGKSPGVIDKERLSMLSTFLQTKLGPDIMGSFLRDPEAMRYDVSGFGALMLLSDYTRTSDSELIKTFLDDQERSSRPSLRTEFEEWTKSRSEVGSLDLVNQFISERVVDLMERTQAAFVASNLNDVSIDHLVNTAKRAYESGDKSFVGWDALESHFGRGEGNDRQLIAELHYLQSREANQRLKVLTPETIQFLRRSNLANLDVSHGDSTIMDTLYASNYQAYNQLTWNMMRDRNMDMTTAADLATNQLDAVVYQLDKLGISSDSPEAALVVRAMLDGTHFSGNDQEGMRNTLTEKLTARSSDGQGLVGLKGLQQSSAALTTLSAMLHERDYLQSQDTPESRQSLATLDQQLNYILDGSYPNLERVQQLMGAANAQEEVETIQRVQSLMRDLSEGGGNTSLSPEAIEQLLTTESSTPESPRSEVRSPLQPQGHMAGVASLEIAGIIGAPLLFALASKSPKLDERLGLLAFDVLQGYAEAASQKGGYLNKLITTSNQELPDTNAFQFARMRHAIRTEGVLLGGAQAILHETLYASLANISHSLVEKSMGRIESFTGVKTTRALGGVLAEVATSTLALGLTRALTRTKAHPKSDAIATDPVTRVWMEFAQAVARAAEEAQLAALNPEFELIDTDENAQLDFETDAIPSELQTDIETGMVVLDAQGVGISVEFEDVDYRGMALMAG